MTNTQPISVRELLRGSRWELPFWLCLFYWSLLPSAWTPWFTLGQLPVSTKDGLLLVLASFYAIRLLRSRGGALHDQGWEHSLTTYFPILLLYAALSLFWSGLGRIDLLAMLYTLALAGAAFLLGYAMVAQRDPQLVQVFLIRLVTYLGVLGLIYSGESFLNLGLRSALTKEWVDFGIQRVRGPLFGSSTGHFILLPALAFILGEGLRWRVGRPRLFVVAFALLLTLVGAGSRAGLAMLAVFIGLVCLGVKGVTARLGAISIVALMIVSVGLLVFSQAETSRLQSVEDELRQTTHETAWETVKNRELQTTLVGSGYGSLWSWYLPDVEEDGARATGKYVTATDYGRVLYHPHSLLLMLGVELGLFGFIALLKLGTTLARLLIAGLRGNTYGVFACGIAVSGLAGFFDLVLFKGVLLSALWWIFLFGALVLCRGYAARTYVVQPVRLSPGRGAQPVWWS